MDYGVVKHIHVSCVALSGLGFCLRGGLMMAGRLAHCGRWVRVVPHIVDSGLLASALTLVWLSGQYPFVLPWLTAKVLGLLAYIILGSYALKRGRSRNIRLACFAAALTVFGYIVSVAVTRSPWGFLGA